ncbi:gfo/Idh/MocA family oxidoreductase [Paenibacillaceae bacterium]|nr:gfo/Idh/MocA family oxidoreductase [Paenibacillaceae bacterium]
MVKLGFIGAGQMAEDHMKTIQAIEHAEITAIVDTNQERAAHIAKTYGAVSYATAEELLDSGKVDAVYLCTPPFARSGLEEAAVSRGIHLLAEKPVGLQLEEAQRNEQIVLKSGVIHSSGYCLRYLNIVQQAKAYLQDKQIDLVLACRLGSLPPLTWWSKIELSGGQLVEQSTHQLDLIRYLAGEFQSVQAVHALRSAMLKSDPAATAYDAGTVSFTLQSGAVGNITSSSLVRHGGRSGVEFYGDGFFVSIFGNELRIVDDSQDVTVRSSEDFYLLQNTAFVEAIRTGNQQLIRGDYSEAVSTLAVTLAANESAAAQGQPIVLAQRG